MKTGNLDWSAPDEEAFAFIADLDRPIGMYLYRRKMYETIAVWETPEVIAGRTPAMLDFARIWHAADKIVYSKSLETVSTPKTRLEREFHPQVLRRRPGGDRPRRASAHFRGIEWPVPLPS